MNQLEPFKIFQIYHAIFLHYTTDSYEYFLYNGKSGYKKETFEKRKDKYAFHKVCRVLKDKDYEWIEYYLAWLFFRSDDWVTPFVIIDSLKKYQIEWEEFRLSRTEKVKTELAKHIEDYFESYWQKDIHLSTIFVVDHFKNTIEETEKTRHGQPLWDQLYKKIKKFKPFYLKHEPIHEVIFKQEIESL